MVSKKITLLLTLTALGLTACGNNDTAASAAVEQTKAETATQHIQLSTDEKKKEESAAADSVKETVEEQITEAASEPAETEEAAEVSGTPVLHVMKTALSREEYDEDILIGSASREGIRLSDEDAERYPELANTLMKMTDDKIEEMEMAVLAMKEEYDFAKSESIPEFFTGSVDQSRFYVQRADSKVFSVREDLYSFNGGAHPSYGAIGHNFDTETGRTLELDDVVTDFQQAVNLVEQTLYDTYGKESFYSDVEEYFDTITPEDISWTMGHQGISFQFSPYVIAPYALGMPEITVWFAEHPELFKESYLPDDETGYVTAFPASLDLQFDCSTDDGWTDTISVYGTSSGGMYFDAFHITMNNSTFTDSEVSAFTMNPYLVCTGESGESQYYLYLYCSDENGNTIYAYDLNGEEITACEPVHQVTLEGEWYSDVETEDVYFETVLTDPSDFPSVS